MASVIRLFCLGKYVSKFASEWISIYRKITPKVFDKFIIFFLLLTERESWFVRELLGLQGAKNSDRSAYLLFSGKPLFLKCSQHPCLHGKKVFLAFIPTPIIK